MKSTDLRAPFSAVARVLGLLLACSCALGTLAQGAPPVGGTMPNMGPMGSGGPMGAPQQAARSEAHYPGGVTGILNIPYSEGMGSRPVLLDLYYNPDNHTPKPAVLWMHGGAFMAGNSRMSISSFGPFDKVLAGIAARGYVAVGVNYRLSGEARFPAAVEDVKAAVQWVRANAAKYDIDPNRIAIWGESAGAYLAVEAGVSCGVKELEATGRNTKLSSCVQAVIDWYGPIDFPSMASQRSANAGRQGPGGMQGPPPGMMQGGPGAGPMQGPGPGMMMGAGGSPEEAFLGCKYAECKADLLKLANPISFVGANTPPFLIMHGDSDSMVPWKQSQELYDALKTKGVPVQFKLLPGLNHMFGGATADQTKEILKTVNDFLDTTFHLQQGAAKN
jgi:acetyl esterase/lipase